MGSSQSCRTQLSINKQQNTTRMGGGVVRNCDAHGQFTSLMSPCRHHLAPKPTSTRRPETGAQTQPPTSPCLRLWADSAAAPVRRRSNPVRLPRFSTAHCPGRKRSRDWRRGINAGQCRGERGHGRSRARCGGGGGCGIPRMRRLSPCSVTPGVQLLHGPSVRVLARRDASGGRRSCNAGSSGGGEGGRRGGKGRGS